MSDYSINLASLLGLSSGEYNNIVVPFDSPSNHGGITTLGTPIVDKITIEPFNYQTKGGYVQYRGFAFEPAVMVQVVTLQKNIVETPVQGRSGTVKELISSKDYDITIDGFLLAKNNIPPYEAIARFNEVMQLPAALPTSSRYLSALGITHIVVKAYDIAIEEGYQDSVRFTVKAVSDTPFELTYSQDL